MKVVDNYRNFDVRCLKSGGYRVYADSDLKEYAGPIHWRKSASEEYMNIDDAKSSIDRYWESRK